MAAFEGMQSAALDKKQKRWERILPFLVVAVLAVLAVAGTMLFYRYLGNTLFQERNSYFCEISDKITQVMELQVYHYREVNETAEKLLLQMEDKSLEGLPKQLGEIQDYLGPNHGMVMVFDDSAQFYASDGTVGDWSQAEFLTNGRERQEIVTALDYRGDDKTYILFVEKLDSPISMGEKSITHMGVAADVAIFQELFDSEIFQGQSHVYVVDSDGGRLYQHICEGGFIENHNLLDAMGSYRFIHGGTQEDLSRCLSERVSGGFEFDLGGENYFVTASPVNQTEWVVLTYVPTEVLVAETTKFLNTAVAFFSVIALLVVMMVGLVMSFFIRKQSDQKLIMHQRQANALLKDAAAAANAANVAKSDFLAHMSHDIRTPINGIMGMTEIALKNLDNHEKVYDCLKKIEDSSGHLLSLVNDVLDMSRIESGKTKAANEPMDMRQIIEHCASIIGGQLQGRDLELVEEFEILSHPRVFGDELHLRQVLINILGNAVKFTPDGGRIYFRVQELSSDRESALFRLEVEDTGIGMKPGFIPEIFTPFAQEDAGMRTSYKGTGLGMAITKKFVDLMGGTITVESQLNKGSVFTVELSLQIDRRIRDSHEDEQYRVDLNGVTLLVAEDNELNMEIAQYLLEDEGIEVVPALDGQEALEAFISHPPGTFDAILMDVMMPVMDGLSAARAIRALEREDAKSIPIIAMTANAYDEDKRRCLEAGMNAHVAKPIDGAVLMQVLIRYIMG